MSRHQSHRTGRMAVLTVFALFAYTSAAPGAPSEVRFSRSADRIDAYDYLEITLDVTKTQPGCPTACCGEEWPMGVWGRSPHRSAFL